MIELPAGKVTLASSILPELLAVKPVGAARARGGPGVAGEDAGEHRVGDRGPGNAARARVLDDDRVDKRLAGNDIAGRPVTLEPPSLSTLVIDRLARLSLSVAETAVP